MNIQGKIWGQTQPLFLKNNVYSKKIIKPSIKEIEQNKIFLKENLKKNFYL